MPTFFHVTPAEKLPSILSDGLLPLIGERSTACGETVPAVYFFTSIEAVEEAFGGWMDNCFDEDDQLALLAVQIGQEVVPNSGVGYEVVLLQRVEPPAITVLSHDLLGESELAPLLETAGTQQDGKVQGMSL